MEKTFTSFIIGSFLFALVLMIGLIIGLDKAIHYLQFRKINSDFEQNISLLEVSLADTDNYVYSDQAFALLERAKHMTVDSLFNEKRVAIAESALLISEYYSEKASLESNDLSRMSKWIDRGTSTFKIASLHLYVTLEPFQKEKIFEFNNIYASKSNKSYELAKLSSELQLILTSELPRLRQNLQKSNSL